MIRFAGVLAVASAAALAAQTPTLAQAPAPAPAPAPPVIAAPQAWTTYTSPQADFSAIFPGTPRVSAAPMGGVAGAVQRTYAVENGGEVFNVTVFDYPRGSLPQPMTQADFTSLAGIFGEGARTKLRTSAQKVVAGRTGLQAAYDDPETGAVLLLRAAQAGDRIYLITYGGPKGTDATPQAQRFEDSLRIMGK